MANVLNRFSLLFGRWLITALLMASIVITTRVYQGKGNFNAIHKQLFGVVIIVLQLLLGLNFVEAFKALANALKPKLTPWANKGEAEMIKQFDSLLTVLRLWQTATSTRLKALCFSWLSLNIVAQMAVALTSLTFSVDDGRDFNDTFATMGEVQVPGLSCFFLTNDFQGCRSRPTMQSRAHTYGQMSLAAEVSNYTSIADVVQSKSNSLFYQRTTQELQDHQQFAYRFNEYNLKDQQGSYPFFTNRTFTAEALDCSKYNQVHNDGKEPSTFSYFSTDGKVNGTIAIPRDFLGNEGTTYIFRGFHIPEEAAIYSCGDRCVKMWAYKNPSVSAPGTFFECSVSISSVTNTDHPMHEIPNNMTKIAAAAIALQGQWKGKKKDPDFEQFTFYADKTPWDIQSGEVEEVGGLFARFAMGSLAMLATIHPRMVNITGHVPHLGHSVKVYEPYFTVLLACIVVAHFAVFAATVFWIIRVGDKGLPPIGMKPLGEHVDESRQNLVSGS